MGAGPAHVPQIHGFDAFHWDGSVAVLFVVRCGPAARDEVRREGFLAFGVWNEFKLLVVSLGRF